MAIGYKIRVIIGEKPVGKLEAWCVFGLEPPKEKRKGGRRGGKTSERKRGRGFGVLVEVFKWGAWVFDISPVFYLQCPHIIK